MKENLRESRPVSGIESLDKQWCDVNLLLNITINDISVIYVTAHILLFTVIPRNRPILVAFYDTHGDT